MRATWYYTITGEEHRDNQPGREEEASLPPPSIRVVLDQQEEEERRLFSSFYLIRVCFLFPSTFHLNFAPRLLSISCVNSSKLPLLPPPPPPPTPSPPSPSSSKRGRECGGIFSLSFSTYFLIRAHFLETPPFPPHQKRRASAAAVPSAATGAVPRR